MQYLCHFKAGATFKIDKYLFKLRLCKFGTTQFFQFLLVVFLQLFLEIGRQVLLLLNMNILVVQLLKSIYKSVFEGSFTLYWHILFFYRYTYKNMAVHPLQECHFAYKDNWFLRENATTGVFFYINETKMCNWLVFCSLLFFIRWFVDFILNLDALF